MSKIFWAPCNWRRLQYHLYCIRGSIVIRLIHKRRVLGCSYRRFQFLMPRSPRANCNWPVQKCHLGTVYSRTNRQWTSLLTKGTKEIEPKIWVSAALKSDSDLQSVKIAISPAGNSRKHHQRTGPRKGCAKSFLPVHSVPLRFRVLMDGVFSNTLMSPLVQTRTYRYTSGR